tara:strand:+ start:87 stop:410 length:324 start_codon:yes stop_codon:yes gene_type:complete
MNLNILTIIFLMALVTFLTRLTPFLFGKKLKDKPFIIYLGNHLPLMIMPILVFSSLPPDTFQKAFNLKEELVGIIAVLILQKLFEKPLLSIFGGTFIYILFGSILNV